MLAGLQNWIIGVVLTLLTIVGLYVAAHGGSHDYYYFGLGMAAAGFAAFVVFIRHVTHKA
jgi:hypothetical protein